MCKDIDFSASFQQKKKKKNGVAPIFFNFHENSICFASSARRFANIFIRKCDVTQRVTNYVTKRKSKLFTLIVFAIKAHFLELRIFLLRLRRGVLETTVQVSTDIE